MRKYTLIAVCFLLIANTYSASRYRHHKKQNPPPTPISYGTVSKGTWFNLALHDAINPELKARPFTAIVIDPIYNKDFSEELIPANTLVRGTYTNDGKKCSFNIDELDFNGISIPLKPSMYSRVSAPLPDQPDCNPTLNYKSGQMLEFQNLVNILNLPVITTNVSYTPLAQQDHFVKAVADSDYDIIGVTKYSNGLMQVTVKFNKPSLKDTLVPIYYDNLKLPHCLNFAVMLHSSNSDKLTYDYIFLSRYDNFGFGVLDKSTNFFTRLWEKI